MERSELLSLSLGLAEAAFEGEPLKDALGGLARGFRADEVMLYRDDVTGAMAVVESLRLPPDQLAEYRSAALPQNPRRPIWSRAPFGRAIDFDAAVPPEALAKGPLGAMMQRTGFPSRHTAGIRVAMGPGAEARFSIGRNAGGAFGSGALAAVEAIAPHLAAALRARVLLLGDTTLDGRATRFGDIELLPTPLALTDALPRLRQANAALRAIVARRDGLCLGQTRLCAADPAADRALKAAAIELPLATVLGRPGVRGITVPRTTGGLPYIVQAVALGHGSWLRRGVLFTVVDPEARKPSAETLRAVLGLTAAEASLAAELGAGATLAEAAKARGVSHETVRTQLKSILAKSGCTRQAELARLLARLGQAGRGP